jgi:chorismate mutase
MSSVKAIRGATQVEANSAQSIGLATQELLRQMLKANQILVEDVISVIFTVSPDLNAAFPASSAREVGFSDTPLLCAVEIGVPGALERVIRILMHCNAQSTSAPISHIYLHGAKSLRSDIAK